MKKKVVQICAVVCSRKGFALRLAQTVHRTGQNLAENPVSAIGGKKAVEALRELDTFLLVIDDSDMTIHRAVSKWLNLLEPRNVMSLGGRTRIKEARNAPAGRNPLQ